MSIKKSFLLLGFLAGIGILIDYTISDFIWWALNTVNGGVFAFVVTSIFIALICIFCVDKSINDDYTEL